MATFTHPQMCPTCGTAPLCSHQDRCADCIWTGSYISTEHGLERLWNGKCLYCIIFGSLDGSTAAPGRTRGAPEELGRHIRHVATGDSRERVSICTSGDEVHDLHCAEYLKTQEQYKVEPTHILRKDPRVHPCWDLCEGCAQTPLECACETEEDEEFDTSQFFV